MLSIQSSLALGGLLAITVWFFSFVTKFRNQRAFYKNVPCPPHDYWWGHLKLMGECMRELPPGLHPQQLMSYVGQKYGMPGVFYLDLWPISYPMMMVHDPGVANQITVSNNLPKHPVNTRFLSPLVGDQSIVLVEGSAWKRIRSIILPGFAPQYLGTLQPVVNKHVLRFRESMTNFATTSAVFLLEDALILLAIDVITEVVLGVDLRSQQKGDLHAGDLAYHFRKANSWTGAGFDILGRIYSYIPKRYHVRWQDRLIVQMMKSREAEATTSERGRAAIDLFLQAYRLEESENANAATRKVAMSDPAFMDLALSNIKSLLLGGHDTTATTICYTIALLSQNPKCLAAMRMEHDTFFGLETTRALDLLANDTSLLNHLPYTTACIKEAMRIFSPASTTRIAGPGSIQNVTFEGRELPIRGQQAWVAHYGIGQRPDLWPEPHRFIPERHLPNPPHQVVKDAWRGFEKGPRACLGMELAMNEMKTCLVCVMRDFDFEVAYPENAPKAPDGFGGHMFQVVEMAAKPVSHMPMKVKKRG